MADYGLETLDKNGGLITSFKEPIVAIRMIVVNTTANGSIEVYKSYGRAYALIDSMTPPSGSTFQLIPKVEIMPDDTVHWTLPTIPSESAYSWPASCLITIVYNKHFNE